MQILISVFNHLYNDQRVEKICSTLHENGYEIFLIGNNWTGEPPIKRPYPFKRLRLQSKKLRWAYVEFQFLLFWELMRKANKNSVLHANDLDALLPNVLVSRIKGIPLVWDSHEIFTEMPSVQGRWVQKIWRFLEKKLIHKVDHFMTANDSYADWFVEKYRVERPVVVRNFPRKRNAMLPLEENRPKIILYQGAINFSRGIDKMIRAMAYLEDAEFHIAGQGPFLKEYQNLAQSLRLHSKVKFLGNLAPEDLKNITEKADVGLSIEENKGLSYYYSLPNKISDYIQARVPVVCSPFPEMKKIVEQYEVGTLISSHEPEALAESVQKVLSKGKTHYLPCLENAAEALCWENEAPKIVALYHTLLHK